MRHGARGQQTFMRLLVALGSLFAFRFCLVWGMDLDQQLFKEAFRKAALDMLTRPPPPTLSPSDYQSPESTFKLFSHEADKWEFADRKVINALLPGAIKHIEMLSIDQANHETFIDALASVLTAADDETYLDALLGYISSLSSEHDQELLSKALARHLSLRMVRPMGDPLSDYEYRRGLKLVRHFQLAGPLIYSNSARFIYGFIKYEFWKVYGICRKDASGDSTRELPDWLKPLHRYEPILKEHSAKQEFTLGLAKYIIGNDLIASHKLNMSLAAIVFQNLIGSPLQRLSDDDIPALIEHHGERVVMEAVLASLRFGLPVNALIDRLNELIQSGDRLAPFLKQFSGWLKYASACDSKFISDLQPFTDASFFVHQFYAIAAGETLTLTQLSTIKDLNTLRFIFRAIHLATSPDLASLKTQFIQMMADVGYELKRAGVFAEDEVLSFMNSASGELYTRFKLASHQILVFYLTVKVLGMEMAVWDIVQKQFILYMRHDPYITQAMNLLQPLVPESLSYYDDVHWKMYESGRRSAFDGVLKKQLPK